MRLNPLLPAVSSLLAAAVLSACGDPLSLLPASIENRIDTLRLYSATNSEIFRPSAYLMAGRTPLRLDQAVTFDFLYDTDVSGNHFLVPYAAAAPTTQTQRLPGFQLTATPFEDITVGEQTGYVTNERIPVEAGTVLYARSAVHTSCPIGLPYYGKLEVLGFDQETHAIIIRFLININCGYRGLELGLPTK